MTIAAAPGAEGPTPPRRAALGVLFVHGIGEQKEGETLIAFGEPILVWIKRWLVGHGGPGGGIRVVEAMLFPSRRLQPVPPHAWIEIARQPPDGGKREITPEPPRKATWLFAEAWWGEQVHAPGVLALLGWLVSRGPWIILAHLWESLRGWTTRSRAEDGSPQSRVGTALAAFGPWVRLPAYLLALLVWVLMTLHIQGSLLLLSALALIPIPRVRSAVSGILLQAAGILGDSQVLTSYETQRGAIVSRFRDALGWLAERADRVAIVAHSQGSAVVYDLLRDPTTRPPWLVFTFGAGVAKLEQLRLAQEHYPGSLNATGWVVPLGVLAVISAFRVQMLRGTPAESLGYLVPLALGVVALVCLIAGVGCANLSMRKLRKQQSTGEDSKRAFPAQWVDRYASHDPVPHGPLDESLGLPRIDSRQVLNRGSFGSDHTTYWRNQAEFVRHVVEHLDGDAEDAAVLGLATPKARDSLDAAEAHHRCAVRLLVWTRYACIAALGWVGVVAPLHEAVKSCAPEFVTGQHVLESVRNFLHGGLTSLVKVITGHAEPCAEDDGSGQPALNFLLEVFENPLARWLIGDAGTGITGALSGHPGWRPVLGIAVALMLFTAATVLWRRCLRPLWQWWDRALLIDVARGQTTFGTYDRAVVCLVFWILAMLPAPILLLLWQGTLASLETITLLVVGIVVAAIIVISVGVGTFIKARDFVGNFSTYAARAWAGLVAATDPQSGWGGFRRAVWACCVGLMNLIFMVVVPIDWWFGGQLLWTELASILGMSLLVVIATVLLEVRLYRLLAPPPTAGWVRLGLVALPPAVALAAALVLVKENAASSAAAAGLGVLLMAVVVLAALYCGASILRGQKP